MGKKRAELLDFLRKRGGLASYAQIRKASFNKALLKACIKSNCISRIDRGLYELYEGASVSNPDFVVVSIKIPRGVICLLSALAFHEATNEIPKHVDVAIPRGTHANKINYPPVKYFRFSRPAWKAGIEVHKIDGYDVQVYDLAKTIADCFKFRNKIGFDVAQKALKTAVTEKRIRPAKILEYAKICRVANVIRPYLEAFV